MRVDEFGLRCVDGDRTFTLLCLGAVDATAAPMMREGFLRALGSGCPLIIVDARDITFIDSAGLTSLRLAHKAAEIAGVDLQVVGARPAVADVVRRGDAGHLLERVENVPL